MNEILWKLGSPIVGAVLGFVGRVVTERLSERTKPIHALLDLLENNRLGSTGRSRLQRESYSRFEQVALRLAPPTKAGHSEPLPFIGCSISPISEATTHCPGRFANGSRPLFMKLGPANQVLDELSTRLDRVEESELTWRLLGIRHVKPEDVPVFWLYSPEIIVRSARELEEVAATANSFLRKRFGQVRLVIEAFLSSDIVDDLKFEYSQQGSLGLYLHHGSSNSPTLDVTPTDAHKYAMDRSHACKNLSGGWIIPEFRDDLQISVPGHLLSSRLPESTRHRILSGNDWQFIRIFGPPGSGKSHLLRQISAQLVKERGVLVLNLSDLASSISCGTESQESVLFELVNSVARERPLVFRNTDMSAKAFCDALYRVLHESKQEVAILVDDMHAQRVARRLINTFVSTRHWLFLLAGRAVSVETPEDLTITLDCGLWSISDARNILSENLGSARIADVDLALKTEWISKRENFSLYLIRAICQNLDDLGRGSSRVVSDAIRRLLQPIEEQIAEIWQGRERDSEKLLETVLDLVKQKIPHDEILASMSGQHNVDLIELLGILSWKGRFEAEDPVVRRSDLVDWSPVPISVDVAQEILDASTFAGILSAVAGGHSWKDKLVGDGCAALYFGDQIGKLSSGQVQEMTKRLIDTNSVDVLTLTLDIPLLDRLLAALGEIGTVPYDMLEKLVTPFFVSRLKEAPEWADAIGSMLLRSPPRRISEHRPASEVLSRLSAVSSEFTQRLRSMVNSNDDGASLLALGALSIRWSAREFIEYVRLNDVENRCAVRVAARNWGDASGPDVIAVVLQLMDEDPVGTDGLTSWAEWCSNRSDPALIAALEDLLEHCEANQSIFILDCINHVRDRKPAKFNTILDRWLGYVEDIVKKNGLLAVAAKILDTYISFHCGVLSMSSQWTISRAGFAVCKEALPCNDFKEIIRMAYCKENCRLPESSDLRQMNIIPAEREVVSDQFPKNQRPQYTQQIAAVIGGRVNLIGPDERNLKWRPLVRFRIEKCP